MGRPSSSVLRPSIVLGKKSTLFTLALMALSPFLYSKHSFLGLRLVLTTGRPGGILTILTVWVTAVIALSRSMSRVACLRKKAT